KSKANQAEKELEVAELFKSLNHTKKVAICISLGLISKEDADPDLVTGVLWSYAKDTSKPKDSPLSKQDIFLSFAKMDAKTLNTKFMIGKAKAAGLIKKTRQG